MLVASALLATACSTEHDTESGARLTSAPTRTSTSSSARLRLTTLSTRFPGIFQAESAYHDLDSPLRIEQPSRADRTTFLTDTASGVRIGFRLRGASSAERTEIGDVSVYADSGIVQRVGAVGLEDYVAFESRPPREEVTYELDVSRVAGLRVIGDTLEAFDSSGTPRLRMDAPYVLGERGERVDAKVSLEGCAFDTSPRAPWGRPVTAPGSDTCTLHLQWSGVTYPALLDPSWVTTASMNGRDGHTAVRLASGQVLIAYGNACQSGCLPANSALLYDPVSKTFAGTGSLVDRGSERPGVLLSNGKVLILANGAQLYDPATGTFSMGGAMTVARGAAAMVPLASGKVLVVGGAGSSAELYDPATDTFTATPPMTTARTGPAATRLASGKVLVVGGGTANAEVYDPAVGVNGSFTATGSLAAPRDNHSAITLNDGKVLVVGGATATAELFDPATGKFTATGSLLEPRADIQATLLPSGNVYVSGGFTTSTNVSTPLVERYVPSTGKFQTAPILRRARGMHRATPVAGGVIVVTGGRSRRDVSFGRSIDEVEQLVVTAPGGTCADDDDCSSGICDHGICCAGACTGSCKACVAGTGACLPVQSADDPDTCTGANGCDATGACKKKDGQTCAAGTECGSGHCTDGFCCNSACSGVCEACDGVVKGRCDLVAGKAHGNRPCASDGTTCGGACDGLQRDVCRFPSSALGCGTSCKDGVRTPSACDGKGACKVLPAEPCPGNYACADDSVCKITCAADADCNRLFSCRDTKCVPAAKCDGDHAILGSDGRTATDCTPYRCDTRSNVCRTTCSDVDQCAAPFLCSADGQCIAPPASTGGCSSSPGDAPLGSAVPMVTALVTCLLAARRSRKRSFVAER
jgi:hypothetical protein